MFAGVFDEVFGVPTHPLAIHAPLVLVPIAAVASVVLAVRTDWRRRLGWFVPAWVLVLVVMLFVAKESGEAAANANNVFGNIDQHEELAETTFTMSIIWFVLTLAVAAWDHFGVSMRVRALSAQAATRRTDGIGITLGVVAAIAAVVTTIWLIRTGHTGSESRWKLD
jgi:preprotein translocase subunit SecG